MIYPVPKPMPRIKEKRARLGARRTPRRADRRIDPAYRARVRTLKCAARKFPGHKCEGRIECDHMGERPYGRKCHDDESGPMCTIGHWARTNYVREFKAFTAVEMRAWCDQVIAETRAKLGWTPPKEAP